ncbi:MAG: saccharopine dehydrogenase C-terminal domain-containing protein [Chloroflexota bacterium]
MAKTVGYPCAIAVKMILDGDYKTTGVSIPMFTTLSVIGLVKGNTKVL